MIVMGDLNAKIGVGNSGVEYVVGRNDNGGRFVDFCSTHHLVIGGTIFQHRTRDKVSWRFRGCLEDIRNGKVADMKCNVELLLTSLVA